MDYIRGDVRLSFLQKKQIISKLFQYMGNKLVHIDMINNLIKKSNKNIYVEPFLGSAQVLLNLRKQFTSYYVSEIDSNLLNIYEQMFLIEENEFTFYVNNLNYDVSTYNGYYSFRDHFNTTLWKTQTKEEAFALIVLMNSCINSMYRMGKNGFNQSYGNGFTSDYRSRDFEYSLKRFKFIKDKLFITNNAFNIMNLKDSLYILDPPYQINEMANSNGWNIEYLQEMFIKLDFISNDIIYFDIENEIGNKYFKNKIFLNKIRNISPNRKEEKILNEVCYYKIGENK
jgi:site-specific DNA-adenine methylase